jgi:nicotinate-nucleotide pyrophosphorylase (carboxylating)
MKQISDTPAALHPMLFEETVNRALLEDLGRAGDITTDAIISPEVSAKAAIVARCTGCVAGADIASWVFRRLDPDIEIEILCRDGMDVDPGGTIAVIRGRAVPILTGERTALNFLSHLSGIATATREIARIVAPYKSRIVCTRKTTPGLRLLEKYAVRCGGGFNHRFGLDDAVLIKDNHIAVAGSISEAVRRVRQRTGHLVKVEVEIDTLEQLDEALRENIDAVLLDNMAADVLTLAVQIVDGRVITEASGGVTIQTAQTIAASGVDLISLGWLTHSAPALNLSLDIAGDSSVSGAC